MYLTNTLLRLFIVFASVKMSTAGINDLEYGSGVPESCGQLPQHMTFINQTYILPDPWTFVDGRQVRTEADWACRSFQLRELFQKYELGYKPPQPPIFMSTFSNNSLSIKAGVAQNRVIDFSVPITYPNNTSVSGTSGPFPAVIVYDAVSIPIPSQVAVITLNVDEIAQQDSTASRGIGLFYELYGNTTTTAGALMAWSWAVSRIIDSLEAHPEANIDTRKLAVTGCSRNGKGALVAGAFDERIALTIPQESGSGGDACWRTSRAMLVNHNLYTQTAWEIVKENVWFAESFDFFAQNNYTIGLLPFDHHELAGLVAPRGLYSTENVEFLWLGDWSNWECMKAANKIYQALGVPHFQGFSQDGPHDHCSFPPDQEGEIAAFFDRFLLDKPADTAVFRTVGNWSYDPSWAPWGVPKLSETTWEKL